MQPGIATCVFGLTRRFEPHKCIPGIAEKGFVAVELSLYNGMPHFDQHDLDAAAELKRVCGDFGIDVWSIHSLDVADLGSADRQERQMQIDSLRRTLDLADTLDATRIVSHALIESPSMAKDPERAKRWITESLAELTPRVKASGAKIAFENNDHNEPYLTTRDVLAWVDRLDEPDAFGFVLDTGHTNMSGDLAGICSLLGSQLISLHLNDNDGQHDNHWPPGEGTVDWAVVWAMLKRVGYRGCIMYEIGDCVGSRSSEQVMAATIAGHNRQMKQLACEG